MKRTFLIADSNDNYRDYLKSLLIQHHSPCEVLEADNVADAMYLLQSRNDIDLVMIDDELSQTSTLGFVKVVRHQHPDLLVLVMSATAGEDDRMDILGSGVHGFLIKSMRAQVIVGAVSLVLAGEVYIPREYVLQLLQLCQPTSPTTFAAVSFLADHLTPRQCEVLQLLVEGHRNKEICMKLNMSMGTIKTHCNAIFRFLNVSNRTQAAQAARRMQLVG